MNLTSSRRCTCVTGRDSLTLLIGAFCCLLQRSCAFHVAQRNIAPASEAEPLSGLRVAPQTRQRGLGGLPHERLALTLLAQQPLRTVAHYWKNRNIDWFSHATLPTSGERGSRANVEINYIVLLSLNQFLR